MRAASVRQSLESLARPKILIVRNDGLGDFVLTLPFAAALKHFLPHASITALVHRSLESLIPLLPDLHGALIDPGVLLRRHRRSHAPAERRRLRAELQARISAERFDLAVLPYAEAGTAALVHRAGIPLRAGPWRRHFFWRFNVLNPASRRSSARSEFEQNLGYLGVLGFPEQYRQPAFRLPAGVGTPAPAGPYIVLHPLKRSGTALTWPPDRFVDLARGWLDQGWHVVAIGDRADEPVLRPLFAALPRVQIQCGLELGGLAALIAGARLFVGNSSGPLHLAGLAGTPHIGLYPKARVMAPGRWRTLPGVTEPMTSGSQMSGQHRAAPQDSAEYLLSPQVRMDCVVCAGQRCEYFNCVERIAPERVLGAMRSWGLERAPR